MFFWVLVAIYVMVLAAASAGALVASARLLKRPTGFGRAACVGVISIYLAVVIATGGAANQAIVWVRCRWWGLLRSMR